MSNTINFGAENFPHLRKAIASARTGGSRTRILCLGDSTVFGEAGVSDAKTHAWPSELARILNAASGLPANYDNFMGQGAPNGYTYNPSITSYSGNWYDNTSFKSIGGDTYSSSGPGGTFSFAPKVPCNNFTIWYATGPGFGTLGLQIGSGTVVNVNTSAASNGVGNYNISGSLGMNTLNLTNTSGSALPVHVFGLESYNGTAPGISIINAGWSGSTSGDWLTAPGGIGIWKPASLIISLQVDLVIMGLNVNDAANAVGLSTYAANLTSGSSLFVYGQYASDLVFVTSQHGQNAYADSILSPYVGQLLTSAAAASPVVPIIDNWSRNPSYAFQNSNGWMYDDIHMNKKGYSDFAAGVAAALSPVIG